MENNLQARRVTYITQQLLKGKIVTVNELHKHFVAEYPTLTKRTIQRDLRLIQEIIPVLEDKPRGKIYEWYIPRTLLYGTSSNYLNANELLSLYFLKAYLKLFKGTVIEEQTDILTKKLEEIAPNDIISEQVLFNDKNIGFYDYSGFDPVIRKIIRLIREKKIVTIEHKNHNMAQSKRIEAVFQMFFTYAELLYAIIYVPKHGSFVALSIQNIEEIIESEEIAKNIPEFDFSSWSKDRFGVFFGDSVDVELEIQDEYRDYFINRHWHPTQKFVKMKNGNLMLRMTVPIVPDFTAWVMSWGEIIKVLKPKELIINIQRKLQQALNQYNKLS